MDKIDFKIISELQAYGRLTNYELADKVSLSPSPCLRRVRNLEKAGIITGYTALVDQKKFGLPMNIFVSIRLEKQTVEAIAEFERQIQDIPDIVECYLMTGPSDYLLHVVSRDLESYERLMKETLTQLPGIGTIESSFAFGLVKKNIVLQSPRE